MAPLPPSDGNTTLTNSRDLFVESAKFDFAAGYFWIPYPNHHVVVAWAPGASQGRAVAGDPKCLGAFHTLGAYPPAGCTYLQGSRGTGATALNYPQRARFDAKSRTLFVADTRNHRIVAWDLADKSQPFPAEALDLSATKHAAQVSKIGVK